MKPLIQSKDLDDLMDAMGDRPVVMLGEASHGTHEYYTWRTAISKRLIEEKGFNFIAVEGDWPACYKVNRFIKGYKNSDITAEAVLGGFDRWPAWMWANWEVVALCTWLKAHNQTLPREEKVGFYGLDVYSLWDSMNEMLTYLENEDHAAAAAVRKAAKCFEPFNEDEQRYARHTLYSDRCRAEVLDLLKKMKQKVDYMDGDREAGFNAEQNALITVNAENYYSAMVSFNDKSWNIRDRHMMETLERLMHFHGKEARGIVWAHNTHIGDARATDMKRAGLINIGQLAREEFGKEKVFLCGFSGYRGSVIAGEEWGEPMQEMEVPAAKKGSIEQMLHEEYGKDGYLIFEGANKVRYGAKVPHRAIGVVYDPAIEKQGNYVPSNLAERYDALLFFNETRALHPLLLHPDKNKLPDTFPFGY